MAGSVDAGKSSLVGVLTHGIDGRPLLDNGCGSARMNVFQHKHEIETGRTSSLSQQMLGYDEEGVPICTINLCCGMLCHAVLRHAVPCYAAACCAVHEYLVLHTESQGQLLHMLFSKTSASRLQQAVDDGKYDWGYCISADARVTTSAAGSQVG